MGALPGTSFYFVVRGRNFNLAEDLAPLVVGGTVRLAVPAPLHAEDDGACFTFDDRESVRVVGGVGLPGVAVVDAAHTYIRSDKDLHFTTALATDAEEQENLAGLPRDTVNIESITLLSQQRLTWDVLFYTRDTFNANADFDLQTWVARQRLPAAQGVQVGGAGLFLYDVNGLKLPYTDQAATLELHVGLVNRSPLAKIAGVGGQVVLQVGVRPTI